eukprot:gene8622-569_t
MSKTLYHYPQARSTRAAWLLFEFDEATTDFLDKEVQIKYLDFTKGEHKSPEYLKTNPFGTVPTWVDGDETVMESAAIVMLLAEQYQHIIDLVPKNEAKYYEYIMFACSTLDDLVVPLAVYLIYTPEEKQDKAYIQEQIGKIMPKLQYLSDELGNHDFFVENSYSCVDIMLGYTLASCQKLKLLEKFPTLQKFVGSMSARKAFQRAFAPEESTEVKSLQKELSQMKLENSTLKGEKREKTAPVLYHLRGSRSTRIAWLLNELGIKWVDKIAELGKGFSYIKSDEYLAINPHATVPTYIDEDGKVLFEAGAIMQSILKRHSDLAEQKGLIPSDWTDKNHQIQNKYLFWCIATADGRVLKPIQLIKTFVGSSVSSFLNSKASIKWWEQFCEYVEADLGDNDYINGKHFTITDILVGFDLGHAYQAGLMPKAPKKIQEYHQRILNRETFLSTCAGGTFKLI